MCGRFTLSHQIHEVLQTFELDANLDVNPSFNIAPTQSIVVIHHESGEITASSMRWGLVPFWMKTFPKNAPMINARAETLSEKPAFRAAYKKRRCLIPADGFYEWKKLDHGKQPYYIYSPGRQLFAFAGLWERWSQEGLTVDSCSIITTHANKDMEQIHHRMPVIIPTGQYNNWLTAEDPTPLLSAFTGTLKMHPVDPYVNKPANNTKKCIEAIG